MANSENQAELKLNLDVSGVQKALNDIVGDFTGTGKEFDKISKKITDSFKNLEAVIKRYGATSKEAEVAMKSYQRTLTSLVANGVDPGIDNFKKLSSAVTSSTNSIKGADGSLKKSTTSWTNFALVIQDLPYGFRGIQNNLPALVGGFAAATGPIYLAISAIVAVITAWDMGLFGIKKRTDENKKSQDSYNESLRTAMESAYGEVSSLKSLISVAQNHSLSMDKRIIAVKKLQDEYPAYFGNLNREKILNGDVSAAINEVTVSLLARAKAQAIESKVGEMAAQDLNDSERKNELQNENNRLISERIKLQNIVNPGIKDESEMIEYRANNYGKIVGAESRLARISEIVAKNNSEVNDLAVKLNNSTLKQINLQNILNSLKGEYIKLDFKEEKAPRGKEPKDKKEKQKTEYFDLTKAVDEYYNTKLDFAVNDDRAQLQILKNQQTTYDDMLASNLISTVKWYDKTADLYKQMYQLTLKIREQESRDAERFANDRVKNVEARLGVELKIHKGSLREQKKDIERAMAEIAALAMTSFNGSAIDVYGKKFDELGYKLEGLGDDFDATAKQISGIVSGMLGDAIATLGENIGNALAGGKFDPFGAFLEILSTGLVAIGKALVAYGVAMDAFKKAFSNPYAAIAAGLALIVAGSFLKAQIKSTSGSGDSQPSGAKAFANGGIISGPTYGLMGEYPGAKSNPEVVAPLDKLKDLIGGSGGGQFVLKGQDLVLAMTRSEKSLNLRRG